MKLPNKKKNIIIFIVYEDKKRLSSSGSCQIVHALEENRFTTNTSFGLLSFISKSHLSSCTEHGIAGDIYHKSQRWNKGRVGWVGAESPLKLHIRLTHILLKSPTHSVAMFVPPPPFQILDQHLGLY